MRVQSRNEFIKLNRFSQFCCPNMGNTPLGALTSACRCELPRNLSGMEIIIPMFSIKVAELKIVMFSVSRCKNESD
ncbi:hypothetical protein BH09BAC3_BH09BAC3_26010 [soil metagenome]